MGDVLPSGYDLRPLGLDDAAPLAAALLRNREHLRPTGPMRDEAFFTEAGQQAAIAARLGMDAAGLFDSWLIWDVVRGDVVGTANLQNIVRGTMQGGTIGYWVDHEHLRRGLATGAVARLVERAVELDLHRLEAGTIVENVASQRVLERSGFTRYGLAPQLLYLDGAWRDHVLYQRLLHDRPLTP